MAETDNRQKLVDLFASLVQIRQPNFEQALATPSSALQEAEQQTSALFAQVVRPNNDEVDPSAGGRQRFPALQGVGILIAKALGKNPDLMQETLISPQDIISAIALDQAVGRVIYAGQLLTLGGETGEVLAGAAAQKMCDDAVNEARGRIADLDVPAATRSDIGMIFEEPFRLQNDEKQRRAEAQAKIGVAKDSYLANLDQKQQDSALSEAVDAYMSSAKDQGVSQT